MPDSAIPRDEKLIIVTEKPQQADAIAHLLAGSDQRGDSRKSKPIYRIGSVTIISMQGHSKVLKEPEEIDGEKWGGPWRSCTYPVLPASPIPTKVNKQCAHRLKLLKEALKGHKGAVLIACDMDREGERIGHEALDHCGFKGERIRMLDVNEVTPAAFKKIYNKRAPAEDFVPKVIASRTRAEIDYLWGMGPSRAASVAFGNKSPLSQGRVQSVALALIVRREREVENFKPKGYFEITVDVAIDTGVHVKLLHSPPTSDDPDKDERIYDRAKAASIVQDVKGFEGPLSVTCEAKSTEPPLPYEANSLGRAAAARFGWPTEKTMQVADSVRLKGLITYIRGDQPYLKDDMASSAKPLLQALTKMDDYKSLAGVEEKPIIRKGSVYNSKKLGESPHHGIIPSISYLEMEGRFKLAELSADERKIFDMVSRRFIAAHMPAYRYDETTISLTIESGGQKRVFSTTGMVTTSKGWRVADKDELRGRKKDIVLPEIEDRSQGKVVDQELLSKQTKPPHYLSEGTMLQRLKKLDIGTSATWHEILKTLRARGYVNSDPKKVRATSIGHGIVEANEHIESAARCLVNPLYTAEVEKRLKEIEGAGSRQKAEALAAELLKAVRKDVEETTMSMLEVDLMPDRIRQRFAEYQAANRRPSKHGNTRRKGSRKKTGGAGKPSEKMLKYAKSLADKHGVSLPANASETFTACSAFIDKYKEA